jgi:hypothetical protein
MVDTVEKCKKVLELTKIVNDLDGCYAQLKNSEAAYTFVRVITPIGDAFQFPIPTDRVVREVQNGIIDLKHELQDLGILT